MQRFRTERDSLGEIKVAEESLWGAQTQRSLEHFSIGEDLMPREMIPAYAILKRAAARVNQQLGGLERSEAELIIKVCDEIIAGQHADQFPLHVWMTGSGTQFNMNLNEVIANRCSQLSGQPLGSKSPVHPNDHVNRSQSSNDSFPTAMCMAAAIAVKKSLLPELKALIDSVQKKVRAWAEILKVGRTHMQDATPMTLGQEFSGYAAMLEENKVRLEQALPDIYKLALGGTAIGTGILAPPGFDVAVAQEIAQLTQLPFVTAPNKFAVQGAHDSLVHLSGAFKTLANSLFKIANDIRLLSCGPRCGFAELNIPQNEPGSSIMPGKVNPTQCEALSMLSLQVIANDLAVTLGGSSGLLEMNVYKPLIIFNVLRSARLLSDGCSNFRKFLIEGTTPNLKQLEYYLQRSLMLVTALSPVIGYDHASKIAKYAHAEDVTLREAALKLGFISAEEFDRIVDPKKMLTNYVATSHSASGA